VPLLPDAVVVVGETVAVGGQRRGRALALDLLLLPQA
jgi:hypothetical protein